MKAYPGFDDHVRAAFDLMLREVHLEMGKQSWGTETTPDPIPVRRITRIRWWVEWNLWRRPWGWIHRILPCCPVDRDEDY